MAFEIPIPQNALITGCHAQGIPIARIFHVADPKLASNPFAIESGHVRPLVKLVDTSPAASFHKNRHSALVGAGLDVWLVQNHIGRLIISGIGCFVLALLCFLAETVIVTQLLNFELLKR